MLFFVSEGVMTLVSILVLDSLFSFCHAELHCCLHSSGLSLRSLVPICHSCSPSLFVNYLLTSLSPPCRLPIFVKHLLTSLSQRCPFLICQSSSHLSVSTNPIPICQSPSYLSVSKLSPPYLSSTLSPPYLSFT